jgi:predicted nucleotidyltransferase
MAVFEPLFRTLNDARVRYVVVGGLAVVLHGHARLTADVDLVVDLDPEQAKKAIDTLVGMGLQPGVPVNPRDFADASIRHTWMVDRGMQVFSMVDPANPMRLVDLFVEHVVPFEGLWERSIELDLQNTKVRVASIPDLIELKRAAGRDVDHADIERLEAILKAREAGEDG